MLIANELLLSGQPPLLKRSLYRYLVGGLLMVARIRVPAFYESSPILLFDCHNAPLLIPSDLPCMMNSVDDRETNPASVRNGTQKGIADGCVCFTRTSRQLSRPRSTLPPKVSSCRSHNRGRRPQARGPRCSIEIVKCAIF